LLKQKGKINFTPREIYLNSRYATMYINGDEYSDMLFYFDDPITKPRDYSIALRVSSFVFPVSFTAVNDSNNKLIIDGITYTLTNGNYSATSMKAHLLSLLPSGYGITYNTTTLKYTFTYSSNFTISGSSTCLELLGFTSGDHTSTGNTLTSDTIVNFTGTNEIYIDIPNISTFNINSKSGSKSSIVKSIPITVPCGNMMYYIDQTSSFVYLQEDALTFFHIRILGEDMRTTVDFNHQHWNMTLEVSFIQKQNITPTTKMTFEGLYQKYIKENIIPNKK